MATKGAIFRTRPAKEHAPEAAHHALAYITRLYEIERATKDSDATIRQAARQEHAVPLLKEFGDWLDQQSFLPKSQLARRIRIPVTSGRH